MIKALTILPKSMLCQKNRSLIFAMAAFFFTINCQKAIAQSAVALISKIPVTTAVNAVADSVPVLTASNFAAIGDYVWIDANKNGKQDAGEKGLANVEVVLYDSLLNIVDTKYTNDSGYYHFKNIFIPANNSKSFIVGFNNIPPDYAYTQSDETESSNGLNSKSDTVSGRTKPFIMKASEVRTDIDGGIKRAVGVVLPLIINQFNGNYADGLIQLGWSTYSEVNIDHFDVERSMDATNFRQISRVNAAGGQLNSSLNYSFLDITAQRGTNYYRLAIVDVYGNYTYSKTIMVVVDVKGISVLVVYPNPFSTRVQIRVNCDMAEKVAINILNSNGVKMSTQLAQTQVGDNNIVINKVDALPSGVYYIEVVSSTRTLRTKVMKLN